MIYILIFIYMFLIPITIIGLLLKIITMLEKKTTEVVETKIKRIHPTIRKTDYQNNFNGKTAYEIYKNKQGLYEPITPSKGIELRKEE